MALGEHVGRPSLAGPERQVAQQLRRDGIVLGRRRLDQADRRRRTRPCMSSEPDTAPRSCSRTASAGWPWTGRTCSRRLPDPSARSPTTGPASPGATLAPAPVTSRRWSMSSTAPCTRRTHPPPTSSSATPSADWSFAPSLHLPRRGRRAGPARRGPRGPARDVPDSQRRQVREDDGNDEPDAPRSSPPSMKRRANSVAPAPPSGAGALLQSVDGVEHCFSTARAAVGERRAYRRNSDGGPVDGVVAVRIV